MNVAGTCFAIVTCHCGERHYTDEPCPSCTMGSIEATNERLAAALRRERFLLAFADRLLTRLAALTVGRAT